MEKQTPTQALINLLTKNIKTKKKTMTPKEKAKKLVDKYNLIVLDTALGGSNRRVKQCALLAVDEVLILITAIDGTEHWQKYYEEVKQEIEKL